MASELEVGKVKVGTSTSTDTITGFNDSQAAIVGGDNVGLALQSTNSNKSARVRFFDHSGNQDATVGFDNSNSNLFMGTGTAAHLTIDSTGLTTFSNGIVTSEKGVMSGTVTIADDAVTTITPARKGGFISLVFDSATEVAGQYPNHTLSGVVFFDCGSSLNIFKSTAYTGMSASLDVSTSNVTGTTGTDGNVTVAVQADVVKVENRGGATYRLNYTIIC